MFVLVLSHLAASSLLLTRSKQIDVYVPRSNDADDGDDVVLLLLALFGMALEAENDVIVVALDVVLIAEASDELDGYLTRFELNFLNVNLF